ncbi:MAG: Fe2+-dependent dioxygenase [Woeseia sp.]
MILRISGAIDAGTLQAVQETADSAVFETGNKSAGWSARNVKNNQQMAAGPAQTALTRTIEAALQRNPVFMAAAQPKTFCRILLARYEPGMAYGTHTDSPLIAGSRADLSFTLFLSPPDTYDGGELILDAADGETSIKLAAGDLVLYPTSYLHRVREVRSGTRVVCVGWVRSLLRLQAHRDILFDLETACRSVYQREGKSDLFDQLSKIKANVARLWAED